MKLQSVPGGWITEEDIGHFDKVLGIEVLIEPGFKTDLASIPPLFRWYVSNQDYRIRKPAIIHDYLIVRKGRCYMSGSYHIAKLTRQEVDQVFYRHLRRNRVGRIKAALMYLAVRLAGWRGWP